MSSTETDPVQEMCESFQELSQEEIREFFEEIWFGTDSEDEYRLNPPWGGRPPWQLQPWQGPNLSMTRSVPDSSRSWPDWIWPGPNWPDRPGSPGPTFPEFPEYPEFPILYGQSTHGSTVNSRAVSQPAISITARSRSDLREEDSNEIPIDVDATINISHDSDEISVASDVSDRARDAAVGAVKGFFGLDGGGSGSGGGGGSGGGDVIVHCNDCTVTVNMN